MEWFDYGKIGGAKPVIVEHYGGKLDDDDTIGNECPFYGDPKIEVLVAFPHDDLVVRSIDDRKGVVVSSQIEVNVIGDPSGTWLLRV